MALCPTCGFSNKEGSKFCIQCGVSLPLSPQPAPHPPPAHLEEGAGPAMPRQPKGSQNLNQLMPASLAEKIRNAAGEITGERREVTVLFADITNFTATAHALNAEDVYLLTDSHFE